MSQRHIALSQKSSGGWRLLLAAGDVTAFLLFVVLGRVSHGLTNDWILNIARIATPFLLGWFVFALPLAAYRLPAQSESTRFLARSLLALLAGNLLAFAIRWFLFQDNVTVPFALTTLAFTGLFVLGWRLVYLWLSRLSGSADSAGDRERAGDEVAHSTITNR